MLRALRDKKNSLMATKMHRVKEISIPMKWMRSWWTSTLNKCKSAGRFQTTIPVLPRPAPLQTKAMQTIRHNRRPSVDREHTGASVRVLQQSPSNLRLTHLWLWMLKRLRQVSSPISSNITVTMMVPTIAVMMRRQKISSHKRNNAITHCRWKSRKLMKSSNLKWPNSPFMGVMPRLIQTQTMMQMDSTGLKMT